jgi:hypothetical protein
MAWCIAKRAGGRWQACEFGSDLWISAAWRWQVSTRRAVAERMALDANRRDLRNCTSGAIQTDIDSGPAEARSRRVDGLTEQADAQRKDITVSTCPPAPLTAEELRANPARSRLRAKFHSMNLDERTFATVRRIAESRGVSLVQVVRLALAELIEAEGAR